MPSQFDDMFSRLARPQLLKFRGETVGYARGLATPAPVTAIVGAVAVDLIQFDGLRGNYRHRVVELSTDEVPDPRRADKLTIPYTGGEEWTIHEVLGGDGGLSRVLAVRPERIETGGRGARGT